MLDWGVYVMYVVCMRCVWGIGGLVNEWFMRFV